MISRGDDYPLHQTSRPVRDPGTDRNLYDRFFFNGYPRSTDAFFAVAMGQYPGRNITDAALSVIVDGVQHDLRATRLLGDDRLDLSVGPIQVEIVEPLRVLRIVADDPESGMAADVTFTARAPAFEEPPYTLKVGHRTLFDYTRLTQNGEWSGHVTAGGRTLDTSGWWGTRDRSWGTRPVGERDAPGAPDGALGGFYWLWAPLNFEDECLLFDVNEHADGRRWHEGSIRAATGASMADVVHGRADYEIDWRSGTRHADGARIRFTFPDGDRTVVLTPRLNFTMKGIGYTHPTQGHGMFWGDRARHHESTALADVDEQHPFHQHIQAVCTAVRDDGAEGTGILEMLIFGPHAPSGFTDLLDFAP